MGIGCFSWTSDLFCSSLKKLKKKSILAYRPEHWVNTLGGKYGGKKHYEDDILHKVAQRCTKGDLYVKNTSHGLTLWEVPHVKRSPCGRSYLKWNYCNAADRALPRGRHRFTIRETISRTIYHMELPSWNSYIWIPLAQ